MKRLTHQTGFTLLELLIAMALGLILVGGVYEIFNTQQKAYVMEDLVAESMQNARVGFNFLIRDIRMAGYDPTNSGLFGFTDSSYNNQSSATSVASNQEIYLTIDDNGDGVLDDNTSEKIGYQLEDADGDGLSDTLQVDRLGSGWTILAENTTALTFIYTYADGETSVSDPPGLPNNSDSDTTNDFEDIRIVQITLTARTGKEDADFLGGYDLNAAIPGTCRTKTLSANVRPRNLGLL